MKKVVLAVVIVLCCAVGVWAQEKTWYMDVLPGYQFKSGKVGSGFVASLDGGYFFTENVGLHFGYTYNEGKFTYEDWDWITNYTWEVSGKSSFGILEVGPEFSWKAGEKGRVYVQLNVGYTMSAKDIADAEGPSGGVELENNWTYGAAFGYRYFFTKKTGLAVQGAYHGVSNWGSASFWDARVGVVFRF